MSYKEGDVTWVQAVGRRACAELSYCEASCTSGTAVGSYKGEPEEGVVAG